MKHLISSATVGLCVLLLVSSLNAEQQTAGGEDSPQQSKASNFTQADRKRVMDAVRQLKPEGVAVLEAKAAAGDAEAQVVLALAYRSGRRLPKDTGKALALLQKAAAAGHPMGANSLALMYLTGTDRERNPAEALSWFRKAADLGYAQAHDNLGWMYYTGEGVFRDPIKAVALFREAAELGSPTGMDRLGTAYADGKGVGKDSGLALEWFRKAAEAGGPAGQFELAQRFDYGVNVPKDHAEAANWYRKAAEQNYGPALFNLAMAYHEGEGVPRDRQAAAQWFEQASNLGYASATYYLGRMYLEGSLGHDEASHRISLDKFQRAAEQGYPLAAMNLGEIHASWLLTGFLTDSGRDYKQACRWLYIARELQQRHQWDDIRPSDAKLLERELSGKITKIEKNLSTDERTGCQREAADWAKAHPTEGPDV